jgi:RimJ/RimL family protein N-acetyltransferase
MTPELITARLRLRPVAAEDEPDYIRLYASPAVMHWLGRGPRSAEESREALERMLRHWREHGYGYWTVRDHEGRFLGRCGLRRMDEGEVELGYTLLEEYWGQGFATEASRAVLEHGFGTVGLSRIISMTLPDNVRSRRVMEKLGMRYEKSEPWQGFPSVWYALERQGS